MLAGEHADAAMPRAWRDDPRWRRVERFAGAWRLMPAERLPHIWLGLAGDGPEDAVPAPFVHLRTEKRTADEARALAAQALEEAPHGALERCMRAAVPTYVGFVAGDPAGRLRVTQPLSVAAALPYLEAIGWPGDRDRLAGLLEIARRWTSHVGLSLNVGAAVEPYLGLEVLNWTKPAGGRAAWEACLDWLIGQGLCTPAKRAALLGWPGLLHSRSAGWRGPGTGAGTGEAVLQTLACNLSHVKLVCPPEAPLEAKAYVDARIGAWGFGGA